MIKHLTEVEHILKRPVIYIGSVNKEDKNYFFFKDKEFKSVSFIYGFYKLFNELIDNSIDEYIRHYKNKNFNINININNKLFTIRDYGKGIENKIIKSYKGEFLAPFLVWTELRAGSNFEGESDTIGTNGVGSSLVSVFSKCFLGISYNKKSKVQVFTKNNQSIKKYSLKKGSFKSGVKIYFKPDLKYFSLNKIENVYKDLILNRLYALSIAYPTINFKLNNIDIKDYRKEFLEYLKSKEDIIYKNENIIISINSNVEDNYKISIVNGLEMFQGTHFEYILDEISNILEDKLKKYKVKKSFIKNNLSLFILMNNFKKASFTTQSKEVLSTSKKDLKEYFKEVDFEKLALKIYKDKNIIKKLLSKHKAIEEVKNNKELNKRINKSEFIEKFVKSVGKEKYLFICEGASALNALLPILGRKGNAYYELKGKPLNALKSSITNNKELSSLYKIIKQYSFEKIVIATDADADGLHIQALLLGFFNKYLPNVGISILKTPIYVVYDKKDKPKKWAYDLKDINTLGKGYYKKGLGAWEKEELKEIIKKDSLENMIIDLKIDDEDLLYKWLGDEVDYRKEELKDSVFTFDLI